MSSMVLSYPIQPPCPMSRPSTPRPAAPLSAPPTPITPTHILPAAMERARSTEGVVNGADLVLKEMREGRDREPKATKLRYELESDWQAEMDGVDRMDVDQVECEDGGVSKNMEGIEREGLEPCQRESGSSTTVWGMPPWGREQERPEIAKGVRLLGVKELPPLVETHSMIDTPSSVMFPWLHGISDDGQKGQDMAQFFGYAPPFEPPRYRGLCLLFCPPYYLETQPKLEVNVEDLPTYAMSTPYGIPSRKGSGSESASSESYLSTGTTVATSPSLGNSLPSPKEASLQSLSTCESDPEFKDSYKSAEVDVAMHPCNSKHLSPKAVVQGLDAEHHPLPCGNATVAATKINIQPDSLADPSSCDVTESDGENPSCIFFNALHVRDVFDLPTRYDPIDEPPRFKPAKLPDQINLRNLNIQQIKYATVSDIVLYSKAGVGPGILHVAQQIAQAQEDLYKQRTDEFYKHVRDVRGPGEGLGEPIQYGVWVLVEPFHKVEKHCPDLVNIDSQGINRHKHLSTDLFYKEVKESREMTKGSEVVEGFWVGNDCDVPWGTPDGVGAYIPFDICLRASECAEMPTASTLSSASRKLQDIQRRRQDSQESKQSCSFGWSASPATVALRSLLSPSPSAPCTEVPSKRTTFTDDEQQPRIKTAPLKPEYVTLECSGSCRTVTGQTRNLTMMTDRVIELVYFLRRIVEGRDSGKKRKVLVHCQDGYTESSIIVLSYIMSSLSISLPEAFLYLQVNANRSFFLYPADKPLLRKVDARLTADRKAKALKLLSATNVTPSSLPEESRHSSPSVRWRTWGMTFGGRHEPPAKIVTGATYGKSTVEAASELLTQLDNGGSCAAQAARVWFDTEHFDGFPSRILPCLYLGNLEHANNAPMLKALGITHVVSVGESLVNGSDRDSHHDHANENSLASFAKAGKIDVLDLTDVRDDGNDPLRPVIARACEWIQQARQQNGKILVHCRVGVSRSATIVIAYMMQYERMGLMDAYMMCRARRLNVLIQPNLRFFHELFGWEVELARREAEAGITRRREVEAQGVRAPEALKMIEGEKRRIVHSWPSFCRDLEIFVQLRYLN
nr:hypothetical protein L204_02561 [Cryptococcus depauperatus CBS 7855]